MPEGGVKTPFDPGTVAMVASGQAPYFRDLARRTIAGVDPAWFSPLEPMAPVAPEGTPPRAFDYPVGYNIQIQPRAEGGISFSELRAFADACDLVRIVIETRKDQISKIPMDVRLRAKPGESARDLRARSQTDGAVSRVRAFLDFPDGQRDFHTWLRKLLEDVFVIDAPAVLVNRTRGGAVHSLEVIDGATIVPKIDARGRRPVAPDVAYQQIIKGMPATDLTADQLVYWPRNVRSHRVYGYSPVEQILTTINIEIRRMIRQLDFETEGTIPLGIAQVGETWSADQIKQFQDMFDAKYGGNIVNRSKLVFTPKLEKLDFPKLQPQKDEFDEWLARVICFAFSIPPTPFIRQINRASAKNSQEVAQEEGTLPLLQYLQTLMNYLIQRVMGETTVEFAFQTGRSADPLKQSQQDKSDVASAILTPNEVRAARGDDPLPGGDALGTITPNGFVPLTVSAKLAEAASEGGAGKVAKKKELRASTAITAQASVDAAAAMQRTIEQFLSKWGAAAAEAFAGNSDAAGKATGAERRRDELLAILAALAWDDWGSVAKAAAGPLTEAAKLGVSEGVAETGASESDEVAAAVYGVQAAVTRAAELVGMKWVDGELVANPDARFAITDATRNGIEALIEQAVEEGWSGDELAEQIRDSYLFSAQRAETIARTEVARVKVAGQMAAWAKSGVVESTRWLLSPLHDHDDVCDDNADAGEVRLGKKYPSGDYGPPAHPNCECVLVGKVMD